MVSLPAFTEIDALSSEGRDAAPASPNHQGATRNGTEENPAPLLKNTDEKQKKIHQTEALMTRRRQLFLWNLSKAHLGLQRRNGKKWTKSERNCVLPTDLTTWSLSKRSKMNNNRKARLHLP
jgi:hypothetical protein